MLCGLFWIQIDFIFIMVKCVSLLKSEDDIMSSLSLPASSYVISISLSYSFSGSVYYYQKYQ